MSDDDEQERERAQRSVERAFPEVARFLADGPRTVTIQTVDQGEVTIPEPAWCRGHEGEPPVYRSDITHNGVTVTAAATTDGCGRVQLLKAYISHAPYLELQPEPHPVVAVQLDVVQDFTAEDIPQLIEGLRTAERVLANVAAEALRLRGGGRP